MTFHYKCNQIIIVCVCVCKEGQSIVLLLMKTLTLLTHHSIPKLKPHNTQLLNYKHSIYSYQTNSHTHTHIYTNQTYFCSFPLHKTISKQKSLCLFFWHRWCIWPMHKKNPTNTHTHSQFSFSLRWKISAFSLFILQISQNYFIHIFLQRGKVFLFLLFFMYSIFVRHPSAASHMVILKTNFVCVCVYLCIAHPPIK